MKTTGLVRAFIFILAVIIIPITAYAGDEIAGKISAINTKSDVITIAGIRVFTANATIQNEEGQPMKLTDLGVGDWVQVEGDFSAPSDMLASKIENKTLEYGAIQGKIDKLDLENSMLLISGVTVLVPISAELENPSGENIPFNMFVPGMYVKCTGEWTGDSELTAVKLETID